MYLSQADSTAILHSGHGDCGTYDRAPKLAVGSGNPSNPDRIHLIKLEICSADEDAGICNAPCTGREQRTNAGTEHASLLLICCFRPGLCADLLF